MVYVFGLTPETMGSFTWQYPDGQVFNSATNVVGVNGAAMLRLNSPPAGKHKFTIKSTADSSYFTAQIDRE